MSNIVIIGGGIAGYTAALRLASKDNSITLIEKGLLGGTCLNKGCIPTKLLINLIKSEKNFDTINKEKDKTVQNLRYAVSSLISAKKIEYIESEAVVLKDNKVLLKKSGNKIDFDKLILAIGSKPIVPKSMQNENVLTSDEVFGLKEIPKSILIIGAGYIGMEFAHIFNKLNSKVYIVEKESSIIPLLPTTATDILADSMKQKGIEIFTGTAVESLSDKKAVLSNGRTIEFDKALVGIGRSTADIESQLEIEREGNFIKTDDYFQTSVEGVYAIGDCTTGPLLAHKAEYDAIRLAENFISGKNEKKNYENMPSCVFSEPSIAHVGKISDLQKARVEFASIGKSYCDGSTKGFLEIYFDENKKIHGGLVVNNNAQEILAALIPIVNANLSCEIAAKMIWVHPTSSEIIKEAVKKALR